jgi:hypothetical protein
MDLIFSVLHALQTDSANLVRIAFVVLLASLATTSMVINALRIVLQ